jgi:hypothetical protein
MLVALLHLAALSADGEIVPPTPAPATVIIFAPPSPPSGPPPELLPKGTRVAVIIDSAIASDQSIPGARFPLHLAETVMIDGRPVLMAGATGEGEVVHAAKARWGGKAGELIINARFLDCGAVRVPLGKMRFSEQGENKVGQALAATMVFTPAMFFISGGNVSVPPGTRADAAIIGDVTLKAIAGTQCAPLAEASNQAKGE